MEDLATQKLHLHNVSLKVRPSVVESSDWDRDGPRFCIWWTGNKVKPPGSVRRHQVIRGKSVTINLDWENALAGYNNVYASIKVKTSKELSQNFWINRTISSSEDKITVDLSYLTSDDSGLPLWVSHGSDYVSPVILVRLYQKNPLECQNMIEHIQNMLYADVFYVRTELDQDYMNRYYQRQDIQAINEAETRKLMCVVGAAMVVAGVATGGATAIWGVDMIMQSTMQKSLFDMIAKTGLRMASVDEEFIDSFSLMHFVSDKGTDLLLQEIFAEAMSLGFGSFTLMGTATAGQAGTTTFASAMGTATGFALKVVAGCALEAVMELAFDVVNTKGAWALAGPLSDFLEANGKYLFFGLMTATTLAGAALSDKLPVGAKLKNMGYLQKAGLSATVMQVAMQALNTGILLSYCISS